MGDTRVGAEGPSTLRTARNRLFWAAIVSGAATSLFTAIVALRMGLVVLDRQVALPGWVLEVWYHVGNVSDTAVFVVLYVLIPLVWVALSTWWWLTRGGSRQYLRVALVVTAVVLLGLPGASAWFVTALWHVKRVFDVEGISHGLIYSRFTDTDYWGVVVVAGLTCVLVLVLGNSVAMMRKTKP